MIEYEINKEETMAILEKFFAQCLSFWEKTLKVDSDLSKAAYIRAIKDIPITNPYKGTRQDLNPEYIAEFRNHRLMDCYGKEWKKYI